MMILFKWLPGSDYQMRFIAEVPDSTYEIVETESEILSPPTKPVLRTATTIKLKTEPFDKNAKDQDTTSWKSALVKQESPHRDSKSPDDGVLSDWSGPTVEDLLKRKRSPSPSRVLTTKYSPRNLRSRRGEGEEKNKGEKRSKGETEAEQGRRRDRRRHDEARQLSFSFFSSR